MILINKTLQIAVKCTLCVIAVLPFNLLSQKIDKIYGENITGDDSAFYRDFANCKSNTDYSAGVYAIKNGNKFKMRFVNFNSSGNITICKDIEPIGQNTEFHPFDIKPLKNNSGYIIVGYTRRLNGILPLICKIDNLGNPLTTKEIWNGGFFSRVIELSNGNFVCCGSHTGSTEFTAAVRNAFYICFDPSLNLIKSQTIIGATSSNPFDNFNDLIEVENNNIVITGTVTEFFLSQSQARLTVAKINPATGVLIWQTNPHRFNIGSPKVNIIGDTIFIFGNSADNNAPFLLRLKNSNGAVISSDFIESSPVSGCVNNILLHYPLFTGVFVKNQDTLFITGKFITPTGEQNFMSEYCNTAHSFNNSFVFETIAFNSCKDATCYQLNNIPSWAGMAAPPIANICNTAQINSNEYSATTYNVNNSGFTSSFDKNKIWIYNNMSNTVHGQVGMSLNFIHPVNTNFTTLNWDEFYITNINNINTNNTLIPISSLDCSLNYPCPCHD